jgi:antitoxin component of MazEF toxin-antitoxin module
MSFEKTLTIFTLQEQLDKYNKDFTHYFSCLTTVHYQINALGRHFKRVANIDLGKPRSQKSKEQVSNLILKAMRANQTIIEGLKSEIENLRAIMFYLKEQEPKFTKMAQAAKMSQHNFENSILQKTAASVVSGTSKLNKNLHLCKNYILPKNKAILNERLALQNRLEHKYTMLNKTTTNERA